MYRCFVCGERFDEPHVYQEETGVVAPDGTKEIWDYETCPHCGSEDFNELETCECCGEPKEYKELVDFSDFCEDCYEELKTLMLDVEKRFRHINPHCTHDDFLSMVEIYSDKER